MAGSHGRFDGKSESISLRKILDIYKLILDTLMFFSLHLPHPGHFTGFPHDTCPNLFQVGAERCLQRAMELIVDTVPFHTPRKSRKTSDATSTRRSTSSRKTGGGVTCEKCNEARADGRARWRSVG